MSYAFFLDNLQVFIFPQNLVILLEYVLLLFLLIQYSVILST